MLGLKRWQLMVLLLIASVLVVKSHKHEEESGHEEDGGEEEHGDHFDEEGHKGEKGYHKKVIDLVGSCKLFKHVQLFLPYFIIDFYRETW